MPECQAGRQGGHPGGGRRAAAEAPEGLLRGQQLLTQEGQAGGRHRLPQALLAAPPPSTFLPSRSSWRTGCSFISYLRGSA